MDESIRFDPHIYRYPSRRNLVFGSRGMIAASHPLAAQAGLEILKKGGNAVDAAIATAATLTFVEPTGCGLGSDAFALVWKDSKLYGINGSGPSPEALSLAAFKPRGWDTPPVAGWGSVTVPGAVATWCELSRKMGRLPLAETLAPAIDYARNGHAVSVTIARNWETGLGKYRSMEGPEFSGLRETFAPRGKAPGAGQVFRSEGHAATLEQIAESGGEAFYKGTIAERIVNFSRETGGFFAFEDLAGFAPEWVDPIRVAYRGYDVWEMPPNGQEICALMALSILKGFDLRERDSGETFHRQIEAIKLAFADTHRYVADPRFAPIPAEALLTDGYAESRRGLVQGRAVDFEAGDPLRGGTVYFATADSDGMMVSFIQSNYTGFGSGVVCPGTGISFNSRAACFTLEEGHPNCLEGGKRPYNTIIPAFLTKNGKALGPFGVMGKFMQPQGHLQVVSNLVDFGMNPQEALDAPRWQWVGGVDVKVEPGFPDAPALRLAAMGHRLTREIVLDDFGRGQIIFRTEDGTLVGATEARTDGCVAAW